MTANAVKEGWKMVPVEPTSEQITAGSRSLRDSFGNPNQWARAKGVWDAILATIPAMPTFPNTGGPTEEEILRIIHENIWVDHETYYGATEAARAILKLLTEKGEKPNG